MDMENKGTIVAIVAAALVSSVCTAAVIKLSSHSSVSQVASLGIIESQLGTLKNQLTLETQARVSLQQQLGDVLSRIQEVQSTKTTSVISDNPEVSSDVEQTQESQREAVQRFREQRRAERLASQQPGYRQQQLVKAGFAQEEAARIVQIESEQSLRQLQAQYDRRRERAASADSYLANTNPIRAELGDQNYERYLEANGFPTTTQISSVIGGSPGESAGLRAGDSIISYAGERVFNLNELTNLTVRGNIGESVLIEVDRDGESVQLTIPRGPIGIYEGSRRRFRP